MKIKAISFGNRGLNRVWLPSKVFNTGRNENYLLCCQWLRKPVLSGASGPAANKIVGLKLFHLPFWVRLSERRWHASGFVRCQRSKSGGALWVCREKNGCDTLDAVSTATDTTPDGTPISSRFCYLLFGSGKAPANSSAIALNSPLYNLARIEMKPPLVRLALTG